LTSRIDTEHTNAFTSVAILKVAWRARRAPPRACSPPPDGATVKTVPIRLRAGEVTRIEL
jgi:hypothetical protein